MRVRLVFKPLMHLLMHVRDEPRCGERRWARWLSLWASVLASASGCSLNDPVPTADIRRGPSFAQAPRALLALPVTCEADGELLPAPSPTAKPSVLGRLPGYPCTYGVRKAVEVRTRMQLKWAGYRLVDSERVNFLTGERFGRRETPSGITVEDIELDPWRDASPKQRQAMLQAIGVGGVVQSNIVVDMGGDPRGAARSVGLEMRVFATDTQSLVWESGCRVVTGRFHVFDRALERAMRCALHAPTALELVR